MATEVKIFTLKNFTVNVVFTLYKWQINNSPRFLRRSKVLTNTHTFATLQMRILKLNFKQM